MSKAALKKELATFTREQLVEVALNAYDSSKEAKDYFEFFLNPDVDKLREKKTDIIARELNRSKWGYSKGRISVVKRAIKDFAAYGVSQEDVLRLMLDAVTMLMGQYRYVNYSEPLLKGTYTLVSDYIRAANKALRLEDAMRRLDALCTRTDFSTSGMRDAVRRTAARTIAELAEAKM